MFATYAALTLTILVFIAGIRILGIVPQVKQVISQSNGALAVIKSTNLSEEQKETAIQKAAVQMLSNFLSITLRVAALLGLLFAVLYLGVFANIYAWEQLLEDASNWYFIGVSSIVMIAALVLSK